MNMTGRSMKYAPGVALCLVIGGLAWFLGRAFPVIGGPVFGILLGMASSMALGGLSGRNTDLGKKGLDAGFSDGVEFTASKLLQYSIVLLGFEMNLFEVLRVGSQSIVIIISTISSSLLTSFFAGRLMGVDGRTATLIGVGTSICGGSAIAATAPVIRANEEEVSQAVSTIFLFNIAAVFIFPVLGRMLMMGDIGFGMWAGTAINDTSSVVAAGASWSAAAGNSVALGYATIVKLARTLTIVPVTLFLALRTARRSSNGSGSKEGPLRIWKVFPWFVIGFLGAACLSTFAPVPSHASQLLASCGKFSIVMAMTAIGLRTDLRKLLSNGVRPIALGLCCWASVAGVSLLLQMRLGIW
jgi:uncharacterized integral membrane protein (TIGR00698 family)